MKLISLNAWGGRLFNPLMQFIQENSATDIFCFQEVFNTNSDITESAGFRLNLYQEISKILPTHQGYFAPNMDNYITGSFQHDFVDFNLSSGLAIFIKKDIKVISQGDFFVFGKRDSFNPKDFNSVPRNIQHLTFENNGESYVFCNLHGIWIKGNKDDSPSRISQSNQALDFFKTQKGEKILAGDFNLNMDTESIKILEGEMKNLIKEYNIKTTRNKHFPGEEKFADYVFVSPGILVEKFEVPDLEVADHLPMILEFTKS